MSEDEKRFIPEIERIRNIESRVWDASADAKAPWNVNLVASAVHPSEINAMLPLLRGVIEKGSRVVLITGDSATDIVRERPFLRRPVINAGLSANIGREIFNKNGANLFLIGGSGGPEMDLDTKLALEAIHHKEEFGKTVIVGIEDDTAGLIGNFLELGKRGKNLDDAIDMVLTADRVSFASYKKLLPIPVAKFITTGPNSWDILKDEQTEEKNISIRKRLNISQDALLIVHYAIRGYGLWSEMEVDTTPAILQAVLKLANNFPEKEVVLLYRFHPGDSRPNILRELVVRNIPSRVPGNLKIQFSSPYQAIETDGYLISAISDIATSSCSTSLTGVALRGARGREYNRTGQMPLYFLSPVVREQLGMTHNEIPAAVQEKAAVFADSQEELSSLMEKAIFSKEMRNRIFSHQARELRDRYRFKGTGTATGRAFLQIRKLLKDLNSK